MWKLLADSKNCIVANYMNFKLFSLTDYFKRVVKKSETDLNDMFTKTYGVLYTQNSKVFIDLFAEFNKYLAGRNLDLAKIVDEFFAKPTTENV